MAFLFPLHLGPWFPEIGALVPGPGKPGIGARPRFPAKPGANRGRESGPGSLQRGLRAARARPRIGPTGRPMPIGESKLRCVGHRLKLTLRRLKLTCLTYYLAVE